MVEGPVQAPPEEGDAPFSHKETETRTEDETEAEIWSGSFDVGRNWTVSADGDAGNGSFRDVALWDFGDPRWPLCPLR